MIDWLRYYEYDNNKLQDIEYERINNDSERLSDSEINNELGILYFLMTPCIEKKRMDLLEKYMRRYNDLLEEKRNRDGHCFELSYFEMYFYYIDAFLYLKNNMLDKAKEEYDIVSDMCLNCEKILKHTNCSEIEKVLFYRSFIGIYGMVEKFYSSIGKNQKSIEICSRQRVLLNAFYSNSASKQVLSNDIDFDNVMIYIKISAVSIIQNNAMQCQDDCMNAINICKQNFKTSREKIWKCLELWCISSSMLSLPPSNISEIEGCKKELETYIQSTMNTCEEALIFCGIANLYGGLGINSKNRDQIQEAIDYYSKSYDLFAGLCELKEEKFEIRIAKKIITFLYPSYVNAMNFFAALCCENEMLDVAEELYVQMLRLLCDNRYADIVAEKKELYIINANSMLCVILSSRREIGKAEFYGNSCLDILNNNDRLKMNSLAYDLCVKCCLALADIHIRLKQKREAEEWTDCGLKCINNQREYNCTTENTDKYYDSLVVLNKKSRKRGIFG